MLHSYSLHSSYTLSRHSFRNLFYDSFRISTWAMSLMMAMRVVRARGGGGVQDDGHACRESEGGGAV